MANRTLALLVIAGCNFIYLVRMVLQLGGRVEPWWWVGNSLFLGLLLVAAFARNRPLILGVLAFLVAAHFLMLMMEWR